MTNRTVLHLRVFHNKLMDWVGNTLTFCEIRPVPKGQALKGHPGGQAAALAVVLASVCDSVQLKKTGCSLTLYSLFRWLRKSPSPLLSCPSLLVCSLHFRKDEFMTRGKVSLRLWCHKIAFKAVDFCCSKTVVMNYNC